MMSFSLSYPGPQPFVVNLCLRENSEKVGTGMRAQVMECLSRMHQDFSSVTVPAGATTINPASSAQNRVLWSQGKRTLTGGK